MEHPPHARAEDPDGRRLAKSDGLNLRPPRRGFAGRTRVMHSLFDACGQGVQTCPGDLLPEREKISRRNWPQGRVTAAGSGRRDERRRDRLSIQEDRPMKTSARISFIASAVVAAVALASPAAMAQDKMGHDAMKQDSMSK